MRRQETVLGLCPLPALPSGWGLHPGVQRGSQTPFTDAVRAPSPGRVTDFLSSLCLLPAVHQEVLQELVSGSCSSLCFPSVTLVSFLFIKHHKLTPASAHALVCLEHSSSGKRWYLLSAEPSHLLWPNFLNFLAVLHGMWDPSSPTRDGTQAPCLGRLES